MLAKASRPSGGRGTDRRAEVLRTTARIFSELGYRGATMEDIARALNVTQPALYYYAKSKDELLEACGSIALENIDRALEQAKLQESGLEQLRAFFRGWAQVISDDFGRCFVLTDPRDLSELRARAGARRQDDLNHAIEEMIRRGIDDRSIASSDPAMLRRALFSAFNTMPRWLRAAGKRSPAEVADEMMAIFIEGVRPRGDEVSPGARC